MKVSDVTLREPIQISPAVTLDRAMTTMEERELRHLPVVEHGRVVGVVSDRDLLQATGWIYEGQAPPPGQDRARVREVMSAPAVLAAPGDDLLEAAQRMLQHGVGCLPVVEDGELVGVLSEVDLLTAFRGGVRSGAIDRANDPPVSSVARERPLAIDVDDAAELALETLHSNGFRHLPVHEHGRVVGVVSDRDLRRAIGRGELDALAVGECMSRRPFTTAPSTPLSTAASLMVDLNVSCLPVIQEGELNAILTVRNLLEPCARALQTLG